MNRQGGIPQTLRGGIPAGFGGQQQPQTQGRSVSNRLPNGSSKLGASNGSGWATLGGGMSGGLQNAPRQQLGGNISFAQSLAGSQPATPLDLSEFPSLSNTSQLSSAGPGSMWSSSGAARNVGGPVQRNQSAPLSSHPQQPEDLFQSASSSRIPASQASFRFGTPASQAPTGATDEFPPLGRSLGGEIGQERSASLMSALGIGGQNIASTGLQNNNRMGNGLLNALSANNRASDIRAPPGSTVPGSSRVSDARSAATDDDNRQKLGTFREDNLATGMDDSALASEGRNPLGAIGNDPPNGKSKEDSPALGAENQDPLAGMTENEKWGIKGLRTLMNNHPDYNAMVLGMDPASLGLDLSSHELISIHNYSLFDDTAPRPSIPKVHLPDCYHVTNVQPIESKIQNFNEETLFWIFYSCPRDVKQQLSAFELHSRNWRWHKKMRVWLTKDENMVPHVLGPNHERGFYIMWDARTWRRDRREITLYYADLDTSIGQSSQ